MPIDRYLLAKEFSLLSADHITINKFTKISSDLMTYQTHRSAFIIPISGQAEILFDKESFTARPGKIIYGSPNKQVSFQISGNEPFEHINLYYALPSNAYLKNDSLNSTFEFTVQNTAELHLLLEKLCLLYSDTNHKNELKKEAFLQNLLSLLFPEIDLSDDQKQLIEEAASYIKQNYFEPLTLETLAKKFNKTPNQFSYLFNKHMGIRPIDYLIQYRLKLGLAMLKEGHQVKEVALSIGYQDAYYFSRLFKKHFHLAPSQIQNQFTNVRRNKHV